MEDAPLNRAHHCEALADSHFRNRKFDKAVDFRNQAEKHFSHCLNQTRNPIVTESVQAQMEENRRQINYIKCLETLQKTQSKRKSIHFQHHKKVVFQGSPSAQVYKKVTMH